jgi:hypothetical protein
MPIKRSTRVVIFAVITTIAFSAISVYAAQKVTATSKITIVLPTDTIPSEETAAKELQHYLSRITGSDPQIVAEKAGSVLQGTAIYVGPTQYAKAHLKNKSPFADEEWAMQSSGNALILTGGRPRGTLYAAYHFLEDVCGVRWWTPWEETVPQLKVLSIANLNRREKPSFGYRDIYELYATDDGGRFMARSRLNRQGDKPVSAAYGRGRDYGPPDHVHTVYNAIYMDPKKYYAAHPDWFLGNGKEPATLSNSQLAMSNPEMRKEFLRLLLVNIRESRAAAIAQGTPVPNVYDVSQNDTSIGLLGGPADEALVKANGGAESAILLSFINYLADGIKDEFPDVYIDTLAYQYGEKAPTNMTVRDNVIIRLTDTSNNMLLPITAERNREMREKVENWARICKNLRIWEYELTYFFPQLPLPTMHTYRADLRFYLQHHVDGVFAEFEYPLETDMRDMKLWVLCKLLENPHQNYKALVQEFSDGYYGAAGPYVRQYLTALKTAAVKSGASVGAFSGLNTFLYLNTNFLQQADGIYAKAAAAVKNDPVISRRVAVARASVDSAILQRFPLLMKEWLEAGNAEDAFPLDRAAAAERYVQAINAQIALWTPVAEQKTEREKVQKKVDKLTSAKVQPVVEMPLVRIGQTTTAPVIDGKLDDAAWKQGVAIGDFSVTGSKTPASEPTQVRLAYDVRNLYIAWRVQESLLAEAQQRRYKVSTNAKKQDDDVLNDDCVVLFLQTDKDAKMHEFNINSIGTLFDAQSSKNNLWGTRDASWNSGAQVAGVQEDGYWTAELAIPWKAFGLDSAPGEGTSWAMGLARHAAGRSEVSSWNQNDSGMIHEMSDFGTLIFDASAPTLAARALPLFEGGKSTFSVQASQPMDINVGLTGDKKTEQFTNKAASANADTGISLSTSDAKVLFQWEAKEGQKTFYRSPLLSLDTKNAPLLNAQ